jgi:tRNA pseudouridine55 synthase
MGRRQASERRVNGILLLDKPSGLTSNAALQRVKRLYRARKAGHTGSLDPLASGLLPVCLGEATKVSGFLLDADKHYWVSCRLGVRTTTADAEGEVLEKHPLDAVTQERVREVMRRFTGVIEQIPPMYSAVKHQGQRLYALARQGVEVMREPRRVTIHAIKLLAYRLPWIEIDVHSSKGTYVRSLVDDIGQALGCGAHVADLRRLGVGPYGPTGMVTFEILKERLEAAGLAAIDALLLPMESGLSQWPDVRLTGDAAYYLRQGQAVLVPHAPTTGLVRLYEGQRRFLGVGEILDDGRVAPRRLLSTA